MVPSRGFYDYAWNPITGCKHGCDYCYARRIFNQRRESFDPTFHQERLVEPANEKKASVIFVGCYADVMGGWVPAEWIQQVIDSLVDWHTFIFITKNPERYREFSFPDNVYLGVTVESPDKLWRFDEIQSPNKTFASIEPIMDDFTGVDLSMFDWVVAGKTIFSSSPMQKKWIKSITHDNLYEIVR